MEHMFILMMLQTAIQLYCNMIVVGLRMLYIQEIQLLFMHRMGGHLVTNITLHLTAVKISTCIILLFRLSFVSF